MKKIIIFFTIIFFATKGMAQQIETFVSGSAVDTKNVPVESATISLINSKDSSISKISVSNKEGKFSFTGIPYGNYFITISAVNFNAISSAKFLVSQSKMTFGLDTLILRPAAKYLSAVIVTSKKPLIEQRIDRMVVNVDASVTNTGSSALEVLERSPGVMVDKDGNISLKGKSAVMIMIDGKPSYLSGSELASLLHNMSANQLSQIEIMTNPSAKYDAAGNAGVINIKTKKSITQGFNGNINIGYGQGVYAKSNNNLSLNYRTGKLNTFLNYGYILNNGFMKFDIQRNFMDSNGIKAGELDQLSNRINKGQNNNLKLGMDYYINPATTIGIVASGFIAPLNQDGFTTSYVKGGSEKIVSIEETNKTVINDWKNGSLNLNFHSQLDSTGKDLTSNLDYIHYNFTGDQDLVGFTYNPGYTLQQENLLKNTVGLQINIYSGRIDYSQPLKSGIKLEAGLKGSLVETNNVNDFFNTKDGKWYMDSLKSSSFNYAENINAAYLNLNKQYNKWFVQAGLRLENTRYNSLQMSKNQNSDSSFNRNYTNLFPTALIGYRLNDQNQFALSVGRRIDRPVYQNLNPFVSFIDKYTYSIGNPFLQPQYSNNIELSHTYKNVLTTTVNYSVITDMINETLRHTDSVIVRSVGNIGKKYNMGLAVSANIPITKWYTGIFYANLYQNIYKGAIYDEPLNAKALALSLNVNNQFSFSNNWAAEISGNYTSQNRDEGQAIVLPVGQVSAGISKQLMNNKASVKLSIRDIFYTQYAREIQNFQDVQSTLKMYRDTRVVNISFVYRFGVPAKAKAKPLPMTDEQKRINLN